MKSYDSFKDWLADQKPAQQEMIKSIRRLIKTEFKQLEETVKWGNGCWVRDELPIVYIYGAKDHFQLGFFAGSMLKDPEGRLSGKGKFVRFVKIADKKDIDKAYFTKLIRQATKIKYR
ncbi:MAG TPA: DUF1801 domain-containing protein [Bdellovibrionales bacterium]|nr:DUF1801 domain-containing protein [Bdellovibrionales bacterium]